MTRPNVSTASHFYNTVRSSQGKGPYEAPLAYRLQQCDVTSFWKDPSRPEEETMFDRCRQRTDYTWVTGNTQDAMNQAYARFQSQISERANWAETLAQYKETYELGKLLFASSWEDLEKIARLYKRAKYKWAVPLKYLNEAYLIWVYALHPLISDCQSTVKILTSDVSKPIKVKATAKGSPVDDIDMEHNYFPHRLTSKSNVKIGATATVVNPNLEKFQAAGLTNPIALGWDLIPFSFVFDWFVDFGGFLHSLDDLFGIELKDSYVSRSMRSVSWNGVRYGGREAPFDIQTTTSSFAFFRDVGGIPLPKPYFKLNLSKWQVIHGLSLLAGIAGSKLK